MTTKFTIKEFLSDAVKPAVGCTEPVAVALAVARAREELGKDPEAVNVMLSSNVFKNGATVGIPGANGLRGNIIAAALAMKVGNSSDGLEIFKSVTKADVPSAQKRADEGRVVVDVDPKQSGVYVLATVKAGGDEAACLIEKSHANITKVTLNKKVTFEHTTAGGAAPSMLSLIAKMSWDEVFSCLDTVTEDDIKFALDGAAMNYAISEYGMTHNIGAGVGKRLYESVPDFDKADMPTKIRVAVSAAADARMGGAQMPVMSSAGSGNHGITAILPVAMFAKSLPGMTDERMAKAIIVSHLATSYVKSRTGGLSTTCGCSFAAGAGCSAGIAWLISGSFDKARDAVMIMLSNLIGILCDGAKETCAFKVAVGAVEGYHAAHMACSGLSLSAQGVVGNGIDETASNAQSVASSMGDIEKAVLNIIHDRI